MKNRTSTKAVNITLYTLSLVNQITIARRILLPLEGTVQFGGSETNLHCKTYFRNRMWKPEFTDSIFPIIAMMSQQPLLVGGLGSCPAGPPLNPAQCLT
jgi:hypothetical protein